MNHMINRNGKAIPPACATREELLKHISTLSLEQLKELLRKEMK